MEKFHLHQSPTAVRSFSPKRLYWAVASGSLQVKSPRGWRPVWSPAGTGCSQPCVGVWALRPPQFHKTRKPCGHKASPWPQLVEQLPVPVVERSPILRRLPEGHPEGVVCPQYLERPWASSLLVGAASDHDLFSLLRNTPLTLVSELLTVRCGH